MPNWNLNWLRPSGLALALALVSVAPFAHAQKGDKKGETQLSRVPPEKVPPSPPLSPDDALKTFRLQPGLRIELFAAEPMVQVPVAMQFDPDGRLWVLEMRGFMPNAEGAGEDKPVGRVSILEDHDEDGRADAATVFLDGLVMPRAFLLAQGGLLLCEPPELWFYPIVDGQPGPRVLVAEDFARSADPKLGPHANPEHSGNSLLRAMDNWIYSLYHSFRYRQVDGQWRREPMPQRVQWGLGQDDFGRLFYTSNSDHLRGDLVPSHYFGAAGRSRPPGLGVAIAQEQTVWPARVNPGVNRGYQPDTLRKDGTLARFTAACGTCVYRGDLFGKEFSGNAFVCEPSANVVRRSVLTDKDGVVTARNAYEKGEFIASTDELFRPVNIAAGPDGALYIADMYHGIIQHRHFLTSYLRAQSEERGLDKVVDMGRIWRVVPAGKSAPMVKPRLAAAGTGDLVAALAHPNGWWRDTAQRLLGERADAAAAGPLREMAAGHANPIARLHALWTLEGCGQIDATILEKALADKHAKVRVAGIRLSEGRMAAGSALREKVFSAAHDPSPEVAVQLALTLGRLTPEARATNALVALARAAKTPLARDTATFALTGGSPAKPARRPGGAAAPVLAKARPLTPEEQKRFEAGRTLYEQVCLACHQQHGLGQPGLAPPLADSEWTAGSEARLIRIVLHGMRGKITVKGEVFELDMPSLGILDDEQIAAILTYVRREWGHTFAPVASATVKQVRQETESREDAWTMPELLKIP